MKVLQFCSFAVLQFCNLTVFHPSILYLTPFIFSIFANSSSGQVPEIFLAIFMKDLKMAHHEIMKVLFSFLKI
jgi:hypothetical protein